MQWVRIHHVLESNDTEILPRHIHVSLRTADGKNLFAIKDSELKTGRANAANSDTKFISKQAEQFLAGVLAGLVDGG